MELIISPRNKINDERHVYVHYSLFPHLLVTSLLSSSLDELRKLFLQNGYPSGKLNYNINDVMNRQENRPEQPTNTVSKKKGPLNSILLHSRILTKQLKACINKFYGCFDVVFQSRARIV